MTESNLPQVPGPEPDAISAQVLTTVLARQSADATDLLGYLAERLSAAWPEAVTVRRRRLFNLGRPEALTVRLGEAHYDLALRSGRLEASVGDAVGGVALRHDTLTVEEWARRLVRHLATAAEQSEAARRALARLTT